LILTRTNWLATRSFTKSSSSCNTMLATTLRTRSALVLVNLLLKQPSWC